MAKNNFTRRRFILQSSKTVLASTLLSPVLKLKSFANSIPQKRDGEYKAIVCLMLEGGADSFNMLIPRGNSEYAEYAASRSNLAIAQNELLAINPLNNDGKQYGLHPQMSGIKNLFENSNLSFISNVGVLVEPVSKSGFWNGSDELPLGLFSHADQSMQWQNASPQQRTQIGWGGKMSDIFSPFNTNQNIPMCISLSGNNVFQHGVNTVEFVINENGIAGIDGYGDDTDIYNQVKTSAIDQMLNRQYSDIYQSTYISTLKKANEAGIEFNNALENVAEFNTQFSDTELSQKFKMIAKTIAARNELGFDKQIFFVRYGGWDHHDDVLGQMDEMLPTLNNAMTEFNDVMQELGTTNNVLTFSMSDFGRTLSSNGNGTDHAWGGNVMVMGGPVNGKNRFGDFPTLALDSNIDVGGGVLIPQLSSDEYLAEIAMWFGLSNTDVNSIFPNLSNFYDINSGNPPIGFLNF